MCMDCGCQEANDSETTVLNGHKKYHVHDGVVHSHDHEPKEKKNDHSHAATKIINVEMDLLAKNNMFAEKNRLWLKKHDILAVNIISSPGSGKTTLLEKTLDILKTDIECSVIVGDQQTDNDARRLRDCCNNVFQIETNSACHLNAEEISYILPQVVNDKTKILFIENVGNLICPAAFDLGENFKIAVLSTTEGEDKPEKYPVIFADAKSIVLTKTDLIPFLDWDLKKCRQHIRTINPEVYIFELSAKTGDGMDEWIDYLMRSIY